MFSFRVETRAITFVDHWSRNHQYCSAIDNNLINASFTNGEINSTIMKAASDFLRVESNNQSLQFIYNPTRLMLNRDGHLWR